MNNIEFNGTLPFSDLNNLPPSSVVYFVMEGEKVAYVGSTANLKARFNGSHHKNKDFAELNNPKISWIDEPENQLVMAENHYISLLSPKLNTLRGATGGPRPVTRADDKRLTGKGRPPGPKPLPAGTKRVRLNVLVAPNTMTYLKQMAGQNTGGNVGRYLDKLADLHITFDSDTFNN